MRCIWQMDGDKVKGFKCDFSPVDMLMIISGLKYIVADVERHPKDRERAQGIYNQIMLCRYYDEADHKNEQSNSEKPNNCDEPQKDCKKCRNYEKCKNNKWKCCVYQPKDEPQTIRCPKCGRSDYIREFGKDFSVTAEEAGFKYKCINCNTYIEPQSDRKTKPTISKMEQVEDEQTDCTEALTLLWIKNMVTDEEFYRIDARLKVMPQTERSE